MATGSIRRGYQGPAFFSYGFRPFFLFASLQAGVGILLWLPMSMGEIELPTVFAPVDWHIHEMLFGYLSAAVGGFLLTAIPNWTGRLPVSGKPLMLLAASWIAGRAVIAMSAQTGWLFAMVVDTLFLAFFAAAAAREICAGKNWRNLKILVFVALLFIANTGFHLEAHFYGLSNYSRRLGISVMLMLVGLIGGRIIPSFTRNWLAQQGPGRMPVPFDRFDKVVLVITAVTLLLWTIQPDSSPVGGLLMLCALLHGMRLIRWAGERTLYNPLLAILHIGYFFVPAGFLLTGLSGFGFVSSGAGLHAWTAGAMAVLTLAVMTRASLGHTGRALVANRPTLCLYGLVIAGALARIVSALGYGGSGLLHIAAAFWSLAFIGFAAVYWKTLTGPRLRA